MLDPERRPPPYGEAPATPRGQHKSKEKDANQFALAILIVVVGFGVIVWYFLLRPLNAVHW